MTKIDYAPGAVTERIREAGRLSDFLRAKGYRLSGRPLDGEFASYAKADIDYVAGDDAIGALEAQGREVVRLLESLDESAIAGFRYAPGKWTVKEVAGHLIDDERIFAYRALCVVRTDARP